MMFLKIKLGSDAESLVQLFKKITAKLGVDVEAEIAKAVAKKMVQLLKKNIQQQLLPLAPLSSVWADIKARKGLDPRILIATRKYVTGIRWLYRGKTVSVTADKIGMLLEMGNKKIPPRPHWVPTLNQISDGAADIDVQKVFDAVLRG